MICPKCGSENVKVQVINEVHMKNVHHGCLWWLIIACGGCLLNGLFLLYQQLNLRYLVIKSKRQLTEIEKSVYANLVDIVLTNQCTANI